MFEIQRLNEWEFERMRQRYNEKRAWHTHAETEWRKAIKKSEMKLQLSLNDCIEQRKKNIYYFSYFTYFACTWVVYMCSCFSFFSCIFNKYKCYGRHIHCNTFRSTHQFIFPFFLCLLVFFFFFFFLKSTACILSRSGFFYLSRYLDHTRIDAYDDTNELYLKAKWMLYCDTGSGLLLDFFSLCFQSLSLFHSHSVHFFSFTLSRPFVCTQVYIHIYIYISESYTFAQFKWCSGFSLSFYTLLCFCFFLLLCFCFTFNLVQHISYIRNVHTIVK